MDTTTAASGGLTPPRELKATPNPPPASDFVLSWKRSILESEFEYRVYRYIQGASPNSAIELTGSPVAAVSGQMDFSFPQTLVPSGAYRYVVVARFTNPAVGEAAASVDVTVTNPPQYTVTITPLKTPAKLGSAVPIKFTVQNSSGTFLTDRAVVVLMRSVMVDCTTGGATGFSGTLYSLPSGATGGSSLQVASSGVPNGFQFNWDTGNGTNGLGCYKVELTLNDGPARNPRTTSVVKLTK